MKIQTVFILVIFGWVFLLIQSYLVQFFHNRSFLNISFPHRNAFFHYRSDVTAQIMFSIHSDAGTSPSHINSTVQTVSVGITGILMLLNMYSKQWDMGSNLTLSLCPWKDTELSLESSCSPVLWLLSAFVWMIMWRICIVWPHARPKQWVKRAACAEHKWIGPSLPCHFWHAGIMIRVGDVLKADRTQHVSELILNGGRSMLMNTVIRV